MRCTRGHELVVSRIGHGPRPKGCTWGSMVVRHGSGPRGALPGDYDLVVSSKGHGPKPKGGVPGVMYW